jgi:immune inhibitor A
MDPWHLDNWGWLEPALISDPTRVYKVTLGQASAFPGGAGMVRGAKILLPDSKAPLPVKPENTLQWWGGNDEISNAMMTLRDPITLPANATLSFRAAWDIEDGWDFLWVQASTNGTTWTTLTNATTTSWHDPSWIGSAYGFTDDLAAAGIGGFTGASAAFPAYQNEIFSLAAFAGQSVRLRFWYMTDWGFEGAGFYLDDVKVAANFAKLRRSSSKLTAALPWRDWAPFRS